MYDRSIQRNSIYHPSTRRKCVHSAEPQPAGASVSCQLLKMREYKSSCRPIHRSMTGTLWPASSTGRAPLAPHDVVYQGAGLDGREQLLGLVRPEHARPHGGRHERLDVGQHEHVGGLPAVQAGDAAHGAKQRRQVRRHGRDSVAGSSASRRGLEQLSKGGQLLAAAVHGGRQRPLPDGQQRPPLGHARAPADRAHHCGVEGVVQARQPRRVVVRRQHERQRGRPVRRHGER